MDAQPDQELLPFCVEASVPVRKIAFLCRAGDRLSLYLHIETAGDIFPVFVGDRYMGSIINLQAILQGICHHVVRLVNHRCLDCSIQEIIKLLIVLDLISGFRGFCRIGFLPAHSFFPYPFFQSHFCSLADRKHGLGGKVIMEDCRRPSHKALCVSLPGFVIL